MGSMSLADFRSEILFLLVNRTDLSNTRLDRWVNAAYFHLTHPDVHRHREVQTRYDFSLTTGTQEYSLSDSTVGYHITGVRNAVYYAGTAINTTVTRRDLRPRSLHWIQQRPAPAGPPTCYSLDGTLLVLDTAPTSRENGHRVRLWVWREPVVLSAAGSVTVLGSYWDRVLLKGAQWMAELDLGLRELAEHTKQDYVALINEVSGDFQLNAEDTGQRVDIVTQSPMESA